VNASCPLVALADFPSTPAPLAGEAVFGGGALPRTPLVVVVSEVVVAGVVVLVVSGVVVLVCVVDVVTAQSSLPALPSWPAPPEVPLEQRGPGGGTVVVVSWVVSHSDSHWSVVVTSAQSPPCAPTSSHCSGVHGCARVHWDVDCNVCADAAAPLTYEAPISPSANKAPITATCTMRFRIFLPLGQHFVLRQTDARVGKPSSRWLSLPRRAASEPPSTELPLPQSGQPNARLP
jgi:hypothetical protein